DGMTPQIGDQDSGRFLKLAPRFSRLTVREAKNIFRNLDGYTEMPDGAAYWDEELRDHGHLTAAVAGLLGSGRIDEFPDRWQLEHELIAGVLRGVRVPSSERIPAVESI